MYGVSALNHSEHITLITFGKIPCECSVLADIFELFASDGINIDMISQSAPHNDTVRLSFTCADEDLPKILALSKELTKTYPELRAMVNTGNAKLQLFGEEMRRMQGVFAKAMTSLRDVPCDLRLVTTSEVDISLLIDDVHAEEAIAALKKTFAL